MAAKNIILKSKIEGVIYELMVKTVASQVYVDDNTTLAAKLSEILADIATKANAEEMTTALAGKAAAVHTHEQSEVNGLVALLNTLATTESLNTAISNLRSEIMGEQVDANFDTFTELAKYIEEHQEAADALNEAIGSKADKTTVEALQQTVEGLGALAQLDKVGEDNLSDELKAKVNAAADGNHSHANKGVIDGITAEKVAAWDASEKNAKDYADSLAKNYDAAGAAAAAQSAAQTYADGKASTAETNAKTYAKEYADGLAGNYDAKGSAAAAETAAKAYADGLAGNYDAKGSAAAAEAAAKEHANGLNSAMDTRVGNVETTLAGKARILTSASQPADLTEQDLWIQLV